MERGTISNCAEHIYSLTSSNVFAEVYRAQGKPEGAEKLNLRTYTTKQKALGAQRPDARAEMTIMADIEYR
jgi:hypothetical protein